MCNDSLAMLGHANYQINMTRREFIKPEMRYDFVHFCASSVPYTKWLFGGNVPKTAKEIEVCSKQNRSTEGCSKLKRSVHGGLGSKSRIRPPYPQRVVKGD